ncbi:VOC family protein [Streptacidiphilus sp. N1-12]|uniref:VOC family protein n=2 Tax=Streptacidiphilus alkalitolerans TaxID=3342712 RepID=A0ABV6VB68_9ACTN
MVTLGTVVMHVADTGRAARFWAQALGYVPREHNPLILEPKDGNGPGLALDESDRMHLDLYADSAQEQQAEVERLISVGAQRVDWAYPDDADFVVLADTEGNLFCVVDTSHG